MHATSALKIFKNAFWSRGSRAACELQASKRRILEEQIMSNQPDASLSVSRVCLVLFARRKVARREWVRGFWSARVAAASAAALLRRQLAKAPATRQQTHRLQHE
jgi:hypothetical protein